MVVWKKVQDSQMDSKWQSRPTGSGAVAVAEHAAVHLDTELAHFGAFGVGGQCAWLVVEGFDLFADGEVFVGDGAVGDSGVNEGHPHRSVPQQRGQGFE